MELIHNLVDEVTAKRILSIPIFGANVEDILVWKYEGSGEYTVKSGYRVLSTELLQNHSYISPNSVDYKGFYNSLWNLNIPAKIKIHIWRLINDLVPHLCNLAWRFLTADVVCPLCKIDLEDFGHLLWSCDMLQFVWASLQIRLRNKLVHEGVKLSLQELLGFIQGYGCDLSLHQETFRPSTRSTIKEVWRPPDSGVCKLNFDATFQHDLQLAVQQLLPEIRKRGYRRLIVEGDSLTVIKSVYKKEKDKSVIRPIIHHISLLNENFDSVTYTFVPRLANRMAHTLAMEGRRRQVFGVWTDDVPVAVKEMALMDRQMYHGLS
ncbi:hypothetical protein CXB51_020001 [Gossypium anomalum]|uniref:Reverse transcriptase n=1 Tax=Gossypium anomalum TaxID=47600 RepID=A0A8J6CT71_9ROSI|nr:hypothetical protein CXB51_020001 [Gossypium anomalum]